MPHSYLFPVRETPVDRSQMRRGLHRGVHGRRLRRRGAFAAGGLLRPLQLGRSEHHEDRREEEEAVEQPEEHGHRKYLRRGRGDFRGVQKFSDAKRIKQM